MSELSRRATIYFDPVIHQALKVRAATSLQSLSELVDEAVRQHLLEDQEDLAAVADRINEPDMTYEAMLNDLKKHGKL
ncbi:MAG: hypothetical protein ACI934_000375 [Pseudohongiellaceae bacterium]|jgi:hypothetical protein